MDFEAAQEINLPAPSTFEEPPPVENSPKTSVGAETPAKKSSGGTVKYRECLKNHAVGIGGHAVDGCGEFMPAGEEGSLDALRCAACNCHRNFHRKEPSTGTQLSHFSPYYRTPASYFHNHPLAVAPQQHFRPPPPPLALPSTSRSGDEMEDISNPMARMMIVSTTPTGGGGVASGSVGKKRSRTKFTAEQKEKMLAFSESAGWRIQRHDEVAVQQFCDDIGVRRHVLKVWMHNNKSALSKKNN